MAVRRSEVVAIEMARLGIGIIVLRRRRLLSIRLRLVCIPLGAHSISSLCGRSAFEVGKLLHP